jgi:hypothetical protein
LVGTQAVRAGLGFQKGGPDPAGARNPDDAVGIDDSISERERDLEVGLDRPGGPAEAPDEASAESRGPPSSRTARPTWLVSPAPARCRFRTRRTTGPVASSSPGEGESRDGSRGGSLLAGPHALTCSRRGDLQTRRRGWWDDGEIWFGRLCQLERPAIRHVFHCLVDGFADEVGGVGVLDRVFHGLLDDLRLQVVDRLRGTTGLLLGVRTVRDGDAVVGGEAGQAGVPA